MRLPLIEVFKAPYEAWTTRRLSMEESLEATRQAGHPIFDVNDKLLARVISPERAQTIERVSAAGGPQKPRGLLAPR